MIEVILEGSGIRHHYSGGPTIDVDHIQLSKGEVLCLLGSSGAGKSTLLRILGLLERPHKGEVSVGGAPALPTDIAARRKIATALQSAVMFRGDVHANVAYGLKVRGVGAKETARRVHESLRLMDIEELRERPVREISGGEAQRVAIARAIAVDSEAVLLDEPLAQVDEPRRESLALTLKRTLADRGVGVLWVTHDRSEALAIADQLAVMEDGVVLQTGSTTEVFSRPQHEKVARLLGAENIFHGKVTTNEDGLATISVGNVSLDATSDISPGSDALALFRPEEVSIATTQPLQTSPRNQMRATIREAVQLGAITKIYLESELPLVAAVTSPTFRDLELRPGSIVWASFKATSVHVVRRT
jgi:tungstate transport system ATP-binding protein